MRSSQSPSAEPGRGAKMSGTHGASGASPRGPAGHSVPGDLLSPHLGPETSAQRLLPESSPPEPLGSHVARARAHTHTICAAVWVTRASGEGTGGWVAVRWE